MTAGEEANRSDVIIVGGGAAGLATAAQLGRRGVPCRVLERGTEIGGSWSGRYERLRLNTIRQLSRMPGLPIARPAGRWVAREDFVSYLHAYRAHHCIHVEFETAVETIDRAGHGWQLKTSAGTMVAPQVVVATGFDRVPRVPAWPGIDSFDAPVLHSAQYRNAEPYRDQDVLVVGAGSSGTEIALDLAEGGARVAIAIRTPPLLLAREWGGIPVSVFSLLGRLSVRRVRDVSAGLLSRAMFGDLSAYGIDRCKQQLSEMIERGRLPTVDTGFVQAVREGRITVAAALERFERSAVVLADGSRLSPDCVVAATAFQGGLEPMLGHLGVVGENGRPRLQGGPWNDAAPSLYFVGYRTALTGHLAPIRTDARRASRAIARERGRMATAGRRATRAGPRRSERSLAPVGKRDLDAGLTQNGDASADERRRPEAGVTR